MSDYDKFNEGKIRKKIWFVINLGKTLLLPLTKQKRIQYKLLYIIWNNIEVYEEPVSRNKKILHHAVKFEAGEENRNVYESLYCYIWNPEEMVLSMSHQFMSTPTEFDHKTVTIIT